MQWSGKVSPAIQKATLRAIDDHQGRGDCFASQATMADEVGCGEDRPIGLAIAALIAQDLITKLIVRTGWHRIATASFGRRVFQLLRDPPSVSRRPACRRTRPDSSDIRNPLSVFLVTRPACLCHPHSGYKSPINANLNAPTNRPERRMGGGGERFV